MYNSKSKVLIVLMAILLVAKPSFGQIADANSLAKEIEMYMAASIKHDYFSGSILIAKNGEVIYQKGYGLANIEHNVPNKINTVFLIGSIAKQFTALATLQLAELGKLNINDPIGKYIKNSPHSWRQITIKNLLNQTSGIVNYSRLPDWDEKHSIQPYTPKELIDLVRHLPLLFNPGEKFNYSNTNYDLLAMIIENVSGMSYHNFLEENIFNPLGMKNTGATRPSQVIENRASGYYTKLNSFVNAPYENSENSIGSGSILSTLADLLLWDQALYSTKLVSAKTIEEMSTPVKGNYGYGTENYQMFDKRTIGHAGSQNGFSSLLLRYPEERITIIVLSNSDKASGNRVGKDLLAIMLNKPYKNPEVSVSAILAEEYRKSGTEHTLKLFEKLKNVDGGKLDEEEVLVELGYDLLDLKKTKDAIKILTYVAKAKPTSSFAHDYLGEAYLHDDNYDMASIYFKKALELDSKNKYALDGLKKVEEILKNR